MLKRNLFFLFFITVFSFLSLILCVNNYNPYNINPFQLIYFYSSFFLLLAGILSIIVFYFRLIIQKKETVYIHFWPAVREGTIISLGFTALLILRGLKLLDIWVGIPIMIIILLLELFFQTKKFKTLAK